LFGQFLSVRINYERNMKVFRLVVAQQALQVDLHESSIQQVDSAHHFGYALPRIVDNDRQLVRNESVAAADPKIPYFLSQARPFVALPVTAKSFFSRRSAFVRPPFSPRAGCTVVDPGGLGKKVIYSGGGIPRT